MRKNSLHMCILNIFDVFDIYMGGATNYNTTICIIFDVFDMRTI